VNWAVFVEPFGILGVAGFVVTLAGTAVVFLRSRAPSQHRRRVVTTGKTLIWVGFALVVAALFVMFAETS